MFSRIAIVNRGEAAMRLIHAVRDLNAPQAPTGAGSRRSPCTPRASGGPCSSARPTSPTTSAPPSARPYLDYAVLERALVETGADAAWVGWGFVAEDPAFAELCARIGVTFIGPSPRRCASSATRSARS